MSTAAAVLAALQHYDLADEGQGNYRCNSPLRSASNSHAFTLKIDDPEHGTYHDHVSGDGGSLYDLADRLGVPTPRGTAAPINTKIGYTDLDDYAQTHGVSGDVFRAAGWGDQTTYQRRPALPFRTVSGTKYRFIDGHKPVFKPSVRGYQPCWYWLDRAVALARATGQPLVLGNGEPSTVVAQHYGVAATASTSGENKHLTPELLAEIQRQYPAPGPVLVASDSDKAGQNAARKWLHGLRDAGYTAWAIDFGGGKGFDLGDFCRLHQASSAPALLALPELAGTGAASPPPVPPVPPVPPAAGVPASGSDPILELANRTDTGNAECLAARYPDRLRHDHTRRRWLIWDGQRWRVDADGTAQRLALITVRERFFAAANIPNLNDRQALAKWAISSESMSKLNAMLQAATVQEQYATTIDRYDTHALLASTPTGTLDLTTGHIRPPNPDDYLTMQLGPAFDPAATCPRWLRFLDEVFAGDQELIAYIGRAVGYSLTGDTREQKFFLCWGGGANGKSVFLKVLEQLLGDYAGNASFDTFDASKRNETSNDLAMLRGKRLVTIIESNEDRRLDEAKVKAVTGGDSITCRFLYGEFFSYTPTFKIWLAMNYKPTIRGTDRGIWRRIAFVPFTENFESRGDPTLVNTLRDELPGILNWALTGLRDWHAHGLGHCTAVDLATETYRRESDEVGKWLLEECVTDADGELVSSDGYAAYQAWARARGERYPLTQNTWGRSLSQRGYDSKRKLVDGAKKTVYQGIRFRVNTDPADTMDTIGTLFCGTFPNDVSYARFTQNKVSNHVHGVLNTVFPDHTQEEKLKEKRENSQQDITEQAAAPPAASGATLGQIPVEQLIVDRGALQELLDAGLTQPEALAQLRRAQTPPVSEVDQDNAQALLVRLYLRRQQFDDAKRNADAIKNRPLWQQLCNEIDQARADALASGAQP